MFLHINHDLLLEAIDLEDDKYMNYKQNIAPFTLSLLFLESNVCVILLGATFVLVHKDASSIRYYIP